VDGVTRAMSDDDLASADEHGDELDLRPRTGPGSGSGGGSDEVIHGRRPGRAGGTRKWPWLVVLGVIVIAIGFVISRAITDATLYYLNADEAVTRQTELGSKHFRLQGTVVEGTVQKESGGAAFKVAYNGVEVSVLATGDPPQLFQECIPVVLDGQWSSATPGSVFQAGSIIVAHESTYEAQNSDRIKQAEAQAAQNGGEADRGACAMKRMEQSPS